MLWLGLQSQVLACRAELAALGLVWPCGRPVDLLAPDIAVTTLLLTAYKTAPHTP